MAKINVYNQEAKPLASASVIVYDSSNKKLGGLVVDKDGVGEINDSWLEDKDGSIVVSYVGHDNFTTKVSKFNGNAFLQQQGVTLGNVVITSKKKKKKLPIKIQNPYENTVVKKNELKKMKSPIIPVAIGGLGLGLLIFFLTKKD